MGSYPMILNEDDNVYEHKENAMRLIRISNLRLMLCLMGWLIVTMMFTGCGRNETSADGSDQNGDLVVSLTDAEGDFVNYTVDVVEVRLTHANGSEVSALPVSTRIDFAQYTDVTEFLTAASVPLGAYETVTLTLDYSNADIWVEDALGELVKVDNSLVADENGDAITQVEVGVELENRSYLVVAPGNPAHLQLDFDLAATNSVTFDDKGVPSVRVDPYLVAEVDREDSKIHRLRGLLDEVTPQDGTFSVIIRPFYAALSGDDGDFGKMTVVTDSDTLFDINDQVYDGQAGLEAMEGLAPSSAVVVVGNLNFDPLQFEAEHVYAGTSVPWGDQDVACGTVVARSGNELSVKGVTLTRSDGTIVFHDLVTVTLGDDTVVRRQLFLPPLELEEISVGQRVSVFGTLTSDDPVNLVLDASEGYVRLFFTTLRGSVLSVDELDTVAPLHVALQSINHHGVENFTFNGTGFDAASDADPQDYEINTELLNLSDLDAGDPVMVRGFVQTFGQAPQDFNARTIVGLSNARAFMKVQWDPATGNAFESISSTELILNLNAQEIDLGPTHHLFRAWLKTDLATLNQAVVVVPGDRLRGLYKVHTGNAAQLFRSFEDFSNALVNHLAEGRQIQQIRARGSFDDATAALSADRVDIRME